MKNSKDTLPEKMRHDKTKQMLSENVEELGRVFLKLKAANCVTLLDLLQSDESRVWKSEKKRPD